MNETHTVRVTAEFSADVTFEALPGMAPEAAEQVVVSLVRGMLMKTRDEHADFVTVRLVEDDPSTATGLAKLSVVPQVGAVEAHGTVR